MYQIDKGKYMYKYIKPDQNKCIQNRLLMKYKGDGEEEYGRQMYLLVNQQKNAQ